MNALSKACSGVNLAIGSFSSIPLNSYISPNPASILSQKFTLPNRLFCKTSAWSLPENSGFPQRSWQQIAPKLKVSLWTPSLALAKSFICRISGATQPGVPHLTKMYYSSSILVARPKSTILAFKSSPIIMLSGLISLCTIPNLLRSRRPQRREVKIFLRCSVVIILFFFMNVQRETPSTQSITRYKEFYVSQTPRNLATCSLFTVRIMLISYSIALLPQFLKAFSFENTFTAVFSPFLKSSARQTVAKLPWPSFLNGLKPAWKPL